MSARARARVERRIHHQRSFILVAPKPNRVAQDTAARDSSYLASLSPGAVDVRAVDLGTVVDAVAVPGDPAYARTLQECYLDFACVGAAITAFRQGCTKPP
jgi:hypothetical protein